MDDDLEAAWQREQQREEVMAAREAALADTDAVREDLARRQEAREAQPAWQPAAPAQWTPPPQRQREVSSGGRNWDAEQKWVEKIIDQRVGEATRKWILEAIEVRVGKQTEDYVWRQFESFGTELAKIENEIGQRRLKRFEAIEGRLAGLDREIEDRVAKSDTATVGLLEDFERRLAALEQRAEPPRPRLVSGGGNDNAG